MRGETTLKNWRRFLIAAGAVLVLAGIGFADTLELKDGRVLQGKYLGGTQAVLRFEVNGDVQAFPTNDIVALTFTRGSGGNSSGGAPPVQSVDPGPGPASSQSPPPPSAPPAVAA